MSDVVSMTLRGSKELTALLERLQGQAVVDALTAGLLSGGELFSNAWKKAAPYKTGTYRRSISPEVRSSEPGNIAVAIGTDITDPPYPMFLEYGTSRMPPHPSMRPAFDENREKISDEVTKAVRQLVNG